MVRVGIAFLVVCEALLCLLLQPLRPLRNRLIPGLRRQTQRHPETSHHGELLHANNLHANRHQLRLTHSPLQLPTSRIDIPPSRPPNIRSNPTLNQHLLKHRHVPR